MNSHTDNSQTPELTRVRVFVPLSRWSALKWLEALIYLALGGLALATIAYATWMGARLRRWEISVALLGILPWWWLFGSYWYWLFRSIRRGGYPLVLLVSEHHGLALGMNDGGTVVRAFDRPSLRETDDEMIITNSEYRMVARLPKAQLSAEHAGLIRRSIHGTGSTATER